MACILLFILGSIFGSFLNVCIYRLPRGMSIVSPRSHCSSCRHKLAWFENVPILSFIFLKGRCRNCRRRISYVYPIVEIITGFLAVILYTFFGLNLRLLIFFALFSSLIVATFIDFEKNEIPDIITLPGIIIGLLLSLFFPELMSKTKSAHSFFNSVLGIIVGGGSLYAVGYLGEIVFKKEAMGGGDIKLLAMVGAFLGWKIVLLTFFIAPFFGSLAGIILKIKKGAEIIAYGPYLSLAAFVSLLFGDRLIGILFLR